MASAAAGYAGPAPNEEKYFCLNDAVGGGELRRPNNAAGIEMDPQKDCAQGRKRGDSAGEVAGGSATSHDMFASGRQRHGKDKECQGYAIHPGGC